MSVASRNPFALLDDDQPSPPSTPQPAPAAAPATTNATQSTRGGQKQRGGGPASRGGRYYQRGGGTKNGPREETAEGEADGVKKFDGRGRGRGRGDGRGRGEGRGRGGRGRNFDRQSGTLPDSDKRVHQGWGGDDGPTEFTQETQAANDAAADATTGGDWAGAAEATTGDWTASAPAAATGEDWTGAPAATDDAWGTDNAAPAAATDGAMENGGAPADGNGAAPESKRFRERDEDENLLTFEEYQAQQKGKLSEELVPKLEGRKANEGSDSNLFKDAVAMVKGEDEEAYFSGKAKSTGKPRAKKEEKVMIEIDAHFERPRSDRGGRGFRGGDRGGRGRGSDRGDDRGGRGRGRGRGDGPRAGGPPPTQYRNQQNSGNVDVNDTAAFPSLA